MLTKIRPLQWYLLQETDPLCTYNVLTTVTEGCQTLLSAVVILICPMPL